MIEIVRNLRCVCVCVCVCVKEFMKRAYHIFWGMFVRMYVYIYVYMYVSDSCKLKLYYDKNSWELQKALPVSIKEGLSFVCMSVCMYACMIVRLYTCMKCVCSIL